MEKGAQKFFDEMIKQGEAEAVYVQRFLSAFKKTEQVMGHLRKRKNVTLRKGLIGYKTICIGSKKYGVPIQKRVDMLMGIDMVTYAYTGRIDKVILFLNDQDVIPAIKEVKRRGINVVLATFKELLDDKKVSVHLIEHCDGIRTVNLLDLEQGVGKMEIAYSESINA